MSNLKCLPTCANLTCCNSFWITSLSSHKTFAAQLLTKTFAKQPGCKFYKLFPAQLFCINSSQNRFQIFTNTFSLWPPGVTYYFASIHAKEYFYKHTNKHIFCLTTQQRDILFCINSCQRRFLQIHKHKNKHIFCLTTQHRDIARTRRPGELLGVCV